MVQLPEVVKNRLPVAVETHGLVFDQAHVLRAKGFHQVHHGAEKLPQRWRFRVHAHPDNPRPHFHPHRLQGQLLLGKAAAEAVVIRHVHQPSVVGVGPTMVGTGVLRHCAAVHRQHPRAAMLTGVEERCDLACFGARDDDGLGRQIENEKVSRLRNILRHTGNQPSARPEPLPLVLHVLARNVALGGNGAGWRGQTQFPGFAHGDCLTSQRMCSRKLYNC